MLQLPVVADSIDAAAATEIQTAIDEALAGLPGVERVPAGGPTFCAATDPTCIADAGQRAGAEQVLHVSARPVGETISLLLVLVGTTEATPHKVVEVLRPGVRAGPVVRSAVVRLVTPERWIGSILVDAAEGSEIWIDGTRAGTTPSAPISGLVPGQHLLRVVRPRGAEARSYVDVRFDEVTRVRIEPRSDAVTVLGYAPPGDASLSRVSRHAPAPAAAPAEAPIWRRTSAISLLAGGMFAVVVGLAAADSASTARDEREALRQGGVFTEAGRAGNLAARYDQRRTLSNVMFIAGGALIAGSGALFALDLAPAGRGAGVALRTRF